jgi:hypothetical protein
MDAVRAYANLSSQYRAKRGSFSSYGKLIPKTTVSDVTTIKKLILGDCKYTPWSSVPSQCGGWDAQDFVHTGEYERAKEAFINTAPGFFDSLQPSSVYSNNAAFWNAFREYATFRSAAGSVPTQWQYAKEAVSESAKELMARVPDIVPDVRPWVDLVKWGTVAGGLYLLYSVLKPEKAKR